MFVLFHILFRLLKWDIAQHASNAHVGTFPDIFGFSRTAHSDNLTNTVGLATFSERWCFCEKSIITFAVQSTMTQWSFILSTDAIFCNWISMFYRKEWKKSCLEPFYVRGTYGYKWTQSLYQAKCIQVLDLTTFVILFFFFNFNVDGR